MSWEAYIAGGRTDTALRDRLITPVFPRVEACATKFSVSKRTPGLRDDFAQAGCIAVMKCAQTYEPDRGVQFWTWAYQPVRYSFLDVMRSRDTTSRALRLKHQRRQRAATQLASARQSAPTTEEIEMACGVTGAGMIVPTDELEFEDRHTEDAIDRLCLQEDIRFLKQRMAEDLTMDQACLLWLHVSRGVGREELAKLLGVSAKAVSSSLADAVAALRRDPVEVALWKAVEELT